jgi:Ring finger domain
MLVAYNNIYSEEPCSICLESMEYSDCIAHDKGGEKHPTHRKCIEAWIKSSGDFKCPVCKIPTEIDNFIIKFKINVLAGAKFGAFAGAAHGAIFIAPGLASIGCSVIDELGRQGRIEPQYLEALKSSIFPAIVMTESVIGACVGGICGVAKTFGFFRGV